MKNSWIKIENFGSAGDRDLSTYQCSDCEETLPIDSAKYVENFNFCPYCGKEKIRVVKNIKSIENYSYRDDFLDYLYKELDKYTDIKSNTHSLDEAINSGNKMELIQELIDNIESDNI